MGSSRRLDGGYRADSRFSPRSDLAAKRPEKQAPGFAPAIFLSRNHPVTAFYPDVITFSPVAQIRISSPREDFMARANKKSSRSANKPKSAKKKAAPARKKRGRPKQRALTQEERHALMEPRVGFRDVLDDAARAMQQTGLRVDGVTPAKLLSLGARESKTADRLEVFDEQTALKRTRLADANALARHDVAGALNEIVATVRFRARKDPTLLEAFAPLIDLMRVQRSAGAEPSADGDGDGA
jgi:hypothetical protein